MPSLVNKSVDTQAFTNSSDATVGWVNSQGFFTHTDLKRYSFSAVDYGAKGDGTADDTPAINAAIAALVKAGRGILLVPPGDYKISGPLTVTPSGNQTVPLLISGYGAKFHLTTATAGWVFQQSTGHSWRHLRVEGLQAVVDSNAVTDAFLFTDGGHSGSFWNWVARDLSVETGTASAPINNGIHVSNTSGTNVMFQFLIESCNVLQVANTTGTGILINGAGGNISSVQIRNPNVNGFLVGIQVGQTSSNVPGANILGGTIVTPQNEAIKFYTHGGTIVNTHTESTWQTSPGAAPQGASIYVEGFATVINQDDHRNTSGGLAHWAIAVFGSGGTTNIVGRGADNSAGSWAKVLASNAGAVVSTYGLEANEVDISSVVTVGSPYLDVWQPKAVVNPTFPGAGGAVSIDASLGQVFVVNVTDSTAFTINNPTNLYGGFRVVLVIANGSGGAMGAVTLGTAYLTTAAVTVPANGKKRVLEFVCQQYHGTVQLIEVSRSTADI